MYTSHPLPETSLIPEKMATPILFGNLFMTQDYYYIYIASEEGGNYQQVKNTTLNNNQWYWNYPHAFGISIANTQGFYIRIATVRDGVVCGTSNPIYVPAK